MRSLLLLIVLLNVSAAHSWAKTYSCTDSSGKTYFSDNLQGLPEECRSDVGTVKLGDPDNLNFVPDVPEAQNSEIRFQHNVRAEDRELKQKKQHGEQFRHRAKSLLARYQQVRSEMPKGGAYSHDTRKQVKLANAQIAQVLEGKKQLLRDLAAARVSTADKNSVMKILDEIDAE